MKVAKLLYLSLMTAVGIVLHIIESFIPIPVTGVPGMRLGLANIINLITLIIFGLKDALAVATIRCFVATLGTGAVTGFFYSITGALLSTLVIWAIYKYFGKYFSIMGVSIWGALAHNVAQVAVASFMINNGLIFMYLPFLMLTSIFTGYFIGLAATFVSNHLKKILVKTKMVTMK